MKVFVSMCSYQGSRFSCTSSVLKMMDYADRFGVQCFLMPREAESLICRARQRALSDMMHHEEDFDYLFTIDDDLIFPEDALIKLLNVDGDIVGGFYRLKTNKYRGVAIRIKDFGDWEATLDNKRVDEAEYVSTGCMLTKRYVIENMIEKFPELEYVENLTGKKHWALYQPYVFNNTQFMEYLSEDWAFCERAKDAGARIWAHGGVQCGHWGQIIYSLDKDNPEECHDG